MPCIGPRVNRHGLNRIVLSPDKQGSESLALNGHGAPALFLNRKDAVRFRGELYEHGIESARRFRGRCRKDRVDVVIGHRPQSESVSARNNKGSCRCC